MGTRIGCCNRYAIRRIVGIDRPASQSENRIGQNINTGARVSVNGTAAIINVHGLPTGGINAHTCDAAVNSTCVANVDCPSAIMLGRDTRCGSNIP
ncbi:hypothetical protein D3C79_1008030 [compost metagenome]